MPVRLLSSAVLKWPDGRTVDQAVRHWAEEAGRKRPELLRIGYFGSYARGNWGVGSDVDLLIIVRSSGQPFERRGAEWDVGRLPVPADVMVYTKDEWNSLRARGRFYQTIMQEAIWVYVKEAKSHEATLKT